MHTALNQCTVLMGRYELSSTSARLREKPRSSVPAREAAAAAAGRWHERRSGAFL
jgi:hypothetical protein